MAIPNDDELLRLLRGGESHRVEFKESMSGDAANAVREAACAFANDLPGDGLPGVVFVGVRDDGSPTGAPITDELLRQLADVKTDGNIVPPPSLFVEKRSLAGSEVAVMAVLPSDSPPARCRGRIHVRTGSRRGVATEQDERILNERRRHGQRPFDIEPVPSARLSDLNLTFFENDYLPQAFAPDMLEANDRTREQRLASLKMIAAPDDPTPTALGLLVLGKSPQNFIPGAYVQFLKIEGTDLADPIADGEDLRGSVSDVIRRLDEKINAHNRVAIDLTSARTERRESLHSIPALRQITRNAVMHRAYEATNAPTRVTWFADRVEVISPGGLYGSVNKENFGAPGVTDYRNPNLAEAMRTIGLVQRFGVGIALARRLMEEAGHPPMKLRPTESHVIVEAPALPPKTPNPNSSR